MGNRRPVQDSMFSKPMYGTGFASSASIFLSVKRTANLSRFTFQCPGTSPSHSTPLGLYVGYGLARTVSSLICHGYEWLALLQVFRSSNGQLKISSAPVSDLAYVTRESTSQRDRTRIEA